MRLNTPLDDIFKTGSHAKVLRALHALPEGVAVSGRDVARRASVSHPTAINVLEHLSEQGVILVERTSNSYRYRLNSQHALHSELARLFATESEESAGLVRFLAEAIAGRAQPVTAAYLFGSAARPDMRLESDLDVLVVCSAAHRASVEEALEEVAARVQERYGNVPGFILETRTLASLRRSQPRTQLWSRIESEGLQILPVTASGEARAG